MKPVQFLQRNKFLVGVAVLVLAGIVTVIAVFLPARNQNAAEASSLQSKEQSLSKYAAKSDMPSQQDVVAAQDLTKAYQQGLDDVRAYLEKQDAPLEAPLKDQAGTPATDGSTWKLDYSQDVDNLMHKIQSSFLVVAANPIVAQQYGSEIPDAKEMATQTRYLRVQQFAIDAIASLNASPNQQTVPVFNGFSFMAAPEKLLSPAHGTEFTPIPFEIKVSAEFPNIPRVIHALLKSPVPFEITSVSIDRPDQLDRGETQTAAWAERTRPGAKPAPKAAAPATPARSTTPSRTTPPPGAVRGFTGPSPEAIQKMIEEQQKRMQESMAQARQNAPTGPPAGYMPPAAANVPSALARRPTGPTRRTSEGTQVTDEIKAKLPKTLVDLTIRGYVADFKGSGKD